MDANITVMIAIKKNKMKPSSYLFNDKILGWAANENSKKRFSSSYSLWTLQSSVKWAKKTINLYKKNKKVKYYKGMRVMTKEGEEDESSKNSSDYS